MNIIAVLCLTFAINTWGKAMYGLDEIPHIFTTTTSMNGTMSMNTTMAMTTQMNETMAMNTTMAMTTVT